MLNEHTLKQPLKGSQLAGLYLLACVGGFVFGKGFAPEHDWNLLFLLLGAALYQFLIIQTSFSAYAWKHQARARQLSKRGRGASRGARLANRCLPYFFDLVFTLTTIYWFTESINFYGNFGLVNSLIIVTLAAMCAAGRTILITIVWSLLVVRLRKLLFWTLPLIITLGNYLWYNYVIHFEWLNLAYADINFIARMTAPLGGINLTQAIYLYLGLGIVLLGRCWYFHGTWAKFSGTRPLKLANGADLVTTGTVAGATAIMALAPVPQFTTATDTPINVALIQPNIDPKGKWDNSTLTAQARLYSQLIDQVVIQSQTVPEQAAQLVVLPESAIGTDFNLTVQPYTQYMEQLAPIHASLLTGAMKDKYNTALLIAHTPQTLTPETLANPEGVREVAFGDYYLQEFRKKNLVPFGEYLPLEWLLRDIHPFFTALAEYGFHRGPVDQGNISTPFSNLALSICYDTLFVYQMLHDINADTDAIVSISNDVWFGNTAGPYQHFNIVRYRAIEQQKPVIRATNNGITAVVNPDGSIAGQVPRNSVEVLYSSYYNHPGLTPYTATRGWSLWAIGGGFLVWSLGVGAILNKRRQRNSSSLPA